jgi:hypothetical protein
VSARTTRAQAAREVGTSEATLGASFSNIVILAWNKFHLLQAAKRGRF